MSYEATINDHCLEIEVTSEREYSCDYYSISIPIVSLLRLLGGSIEEIAND